MLVLSCRFSLFQIARVDLETAVRSKTADKAILQMCGVRGSSCLRVRYVQSHPTRKQGE